MTPCPSPINIKARNMVKKPKVHIYTANKVLKEQHEAHGKRDDGEE